MDFRYLQRHDCGVSFSVNASVENTDSEVNTSLVESRRMEFGIISTTLNIISQGTHTLVQVALLCLLGIQTLCSLYARCTTLSQKASQVMSYQRLKALE